MGVAASLIIEAFMVGVWTDITADTDARFGLRLKYGVVGNGPMDVLASTGPLTFALKNDASNSGGVQGYYSPIHASKRAGWTFGIPIRVTFFDGATPYVKFRGKVRSILADAGQYRRQRVIVTAYDGMRDLMEADIREVEVQSDQLEDELIDAVLDAVPVDSQPIARDLDVGVDVYSIAFADLAGGTKAATVLQNIIFSAQGFGAITGDGTFIYRTRSARSIQTSAYAFDNTMHGLTVPATLDKVYDLVRVTVHPKTIDVAATTVLFAMTGPPPEIVPGSPPRELWGDYRDPNDPTVAIGGLDVVDGVLTTDGTDYAANTLADGSGADITTDVSVTAYGFSSAVKFTVTNNHPTATAFLVTGAGATHLRIRGKGVYDLAPPTVQSAGAGVRPLNLDLPLQDDINVAQGLADFIQSQRASLNEQIDAIEFIANDSAAFMTQALAREPGDRITVTELVTGAASDAFIQSVELDVQPGPWVTCRWGLSPATVAGNVFILDDAVAGVLDTSALGYA